MKYLTIAAAVLSTATPLFAGGAEMVAKNISVLTIGDVTLHSYYGISNAHVIETENELRLVDAQMVFPDAQKLLAYIETLDKPLVEVILSHSHPDHWFGAEVFTPSAAIATSANITADLAQTGQASADNLQQYMEGVIPTEVIVPSIEVTLGAQKWDGVDIIIEEFSDHEAAHSLLIKLPEQGVMIGQDLFYNDVFLVASNEKGNAHWQEILSELKRESAQYPHLLTGHGVNGGPDILDQDIAYLDVLEEVLGLELSVEDTKAEMIKRFPNLGGESLLDISLRKLFSAH